LFVYKEANFGPWF